MWNAFLDQEQLFTFEKKCCVSSASGLIAQWQHYLPGELPGPEECEIPQISQGSALPSSTPPKPLFCTSRGSGRWQKANYGNRVAQTYQGNSLCNGNLKILNSPPFPLGAEQRACTQNSGISISSHRRGGTDRNESWSRYFSDSFQQTEQGEWLVLKTQSFAISCTLCLIPLVIKQLAGRIYFFFLSNCSDPGG